MFWRSDITAFIPLIVGSANRFIDARQLTKFLQLHVHLLIRDDREGLIFRQGDILVLIQDPLRDFIVLYPEGIGRFDRSNADERILDVGLFQVLDIGIAKAGIAAEYKYITNLH